MLIFLAVLLVSQPVAATVFGDGDPDNGVEDARIGISDPDFSGANPERWYRNAGTVHCDGAVRGSAVILKLDKFNAFGGPVVIATSAHVLFDLEVGHRFELCEFHFMGLGSLEGYRAKLGEVLLGTFDPANDHDDERHGQGDWAFAELDRQWTPPLTTSGFEPRVWEDSLAQDRHGLVALNRSTQELSIAMNCSAQRSKKGDLGGGSWALQLLDDCDSDEGASGGGLLVYEAGDVFFVGVRGGAHWNASDFPMDRFPGGPPPGEPWDVTRNTNFARGFDEQLLGQLLTWVSRRGLR